MLDNTVILELEKREVERGASYLLCDDRRLSTPYRIGIVPRIY